MIVTTLNAYTLDIMKYTCFILLATILLQSCIGNDVINDRVDERVRITNRLDTLGVGDNVTLDYVYTNNVGKEAGAEVFWMSSNPEVATINDAGIIMGISNGTTTITAEVISSQSPDEIVDAFDLVVDTETIITESITSRKGILQSTSSYSLSGDFELRDTDGQLQLILGDNFETSDALPGLYVYLTNNPTTTNGAVSIGPVTQFEGGHSYDILSMVGIEDFQYVLFFCKPFNVKVGDGLIN
jgi:hypothetical protein